MTRKSLESFRRLSSECPSAEWLSPLEPQEQSDSRFDPRESSLRHRTYAFLKVVPVNRDELRHGRDRVARQAGLVDLQENVSGGVEKSSARGEDNANDGWEPATIERLALKDQDRVSEAGLRPTRLGKVRPPDFPAVDYHPDFPMLLA